MCNVHVHCATDACKLANNIAKKNSIYFYFYWNQTPGMEKFDGAVENDYTVDKKCLWNCNCSGIRAL